MFAVFALNNMGARQTIKHINDNLQRASWDLASNLKKNHINTVFT